MSTLIDKFTKNASEEIQTSYNQFNGNDLLDIRIFYEDESGKYKPSRKGISLNVNQLPQLEKAIQKAKEFLEKEGLLANHPSEKHRMQN